MSDETENIEQPIDQEELIEALKDEAESEFELVEALDEPIQEIIQDTSEAESNQWLTQPLLTSTNLDWEKMIWITILVLTIITRFWALGDRVVSHDESLHTHYSYQYYIGDGFAHTPLMHGPFLFHATAFSYWLFGANDFTARIPVALFGVLMVFIPWFMRHWIGRVGAIFAGIILLISPFSLYYSRYIRHDVYVIVWALIIMMGMFYYFKNRDDRSIYWVAAGLALMYATKEVSFIYTAIFGGFIIIRFLAKIWPEDWFRKAILSINMPVIVIVLGLLVTGAGFALEFLATPDAAALAEGVEEVENIFFGVMQVAGLFILSGGLFFLADSLFDKLKEYAEFDLIVIFTTFVLPMMTPLLVTFLGKNSLDYNLNRCAVPNAEVLNGFQEVMYRLTDGPCRLLLFQSTITTTSIIMILLLMISIYVGLWWNRRVWVPAAIIFHVLFAVLYTSVFSNPWGWMTGAVGSLGYWLEQQEVARGGQPWFYYLFVTPFYEFLPVLFSLFAVRLWSSKNGYGAASRFWGWFILIGALIMGLVNWYYNGVNQFVGDSFSRLPGLAAFAIVLVGGAVGWFAMGDTFGRTDSAAAALRKKVTRDDWFDFVPFSIFWLIATVVAYTIAGEKMPWLSIHIVIPMAFLVGWYFNELLKDFDLAAFVQEKTLIFFGLVTLLIAVAALFIGPVFIGEIQFGNQSQVGLQSVGRFMGLAILTGFVGWLVYRMIDEVPDRMRRQTWIFSTFILLGLLTSRFAWMASFPNADLTTEYLVYAHGAPATRQAVMPQLEELSKRLYGDMSLKIYYDNEASWPYTWYLREFDQRVYMGENPGPDAKNADAILVGDANYSKIEPLVGDDFEYMEFTFLWWPMEEYRNITWTSILGDPAVEGDQSLLSSPQWRRGVWDIFFYRNYDSYGELKGSNFALGSWPLKRNMRLYIRRDALTQLWDKGVGATVIQPPVDLYAAGERPFSPNLIIGQGALNAPRNVAVANDGRIYVADSGNHQVQVFGTDGAPLFAFGENGPEAGQFNEPWGIAVDDEFVYISDTWNNRVQKFTLDGEFVMQFGIGGTPATANEGGGQFYGPRDIMLGNDNTLMVTDTGNHRIQLFNRDGLFLSAVGGQGVRPGEFYEPVGLAVAPDGAILVADTWNNRVQEFIISENQMFPVNEWTVDAWDNSQSIVNKPYITSDPNGNIIMTDPEGYRVLFFNRSGAYLGRFGEFTGSTNGFSLPIGITTDAQGQVYVVDGQLGVVYRFDPVQ